METLLFTLLGAGIGCGVWFVLRGVFARRAIPLDLLASRLAGTGISVHEKEVNGSTRRADGGLTSFAHQLVVRYSTASQDTLTRRLRLVGRTEADFTLEKLTASVAGFCFPVVLAVLAVAADAGIAVGWIAIASIGLAILGFIYPDLPLAERADERRREFRFALGAYLDFVTIMLAGGAGTQSALQAAAEAGDGWAFAELRNALALANSTGRSVWETYAELADELGVDELHELASSVALAGGQGGRVKNSLIAKADALRVAQAAELEALSEAQTEKMIIPVVVMIAGLVLFIGVGAVDVVSGGAGTPPPDAIDAGEGNR